MLQLAVKLGKTLDSTDNQKNKMSSQTPTVEASTQVPSSPQVQPIRKPRVDWDITRHEPVVCKTVCQQDWVFYENIKIGDTAIALQAGNRALSLNPSKNPQSKQLSDSQLRKRYA